MRCSYIVNPNKQVWDVTGAYDKTVWLEYYYTLKGDYRHKIKGDRDNTFILNVTGETFISLAREMRDNWKIAWTGRKD